MRLFFFGPFKGSPKICCAINLISFRPFLYNKYVKKCFYRQDASLSNFLRLFKILIATFVPALLATLTDGDRKMRERERETDRDDAIRILSKIGHNFQKKKRKKIPGIDFTKLGGPARGTNGLSFFFLSSPRICSSPVLYPSSTTFTSQPISRSRGLSGGLPQGFFFFDVVTWKTLGVTPDWDTPHPPLPR